MNVPHEAVRESRGATAALTRAHTPSPNDLNSGVVDARPMTLKTPQSGDGRTACLKMPMLVSRSEDDRSLDQADSTGHGGEHDHWRLRQHNGADERHARTDRAKVVISGWGRRG
jgi:hypothetical protein